MLIDCRHCKELNCVGCNMLTLQQMLYEGKFNRIMGKHHEIDGNANIQRVRKGKWQGVSPFVDSEECSLCRYCIYDAELRTPYCPGCGAFMENWNNEG